MGKKTTNEAPNLNHVANKEVLQRLNFLYQASFYLSSCSASLDDSTTHHLPRNDGQKKRRSSSDDYLGKVSRSYIRSMKSLANKKVVKMCVFTNRFACCSFSSSMARDPAIKRTLCKGCNTVLVPGSTASVRVKSSKPHGHAVTYTCLTCKTSKRIPAPPTLSIDPEASLSTPSQEASSSSMAVNLDVETVPVEGDASTKGHVEQLVNSTRRTPRRKKKPPKPRLPHLFERDAGHIIFRGNEKLSTERDSGVHLS